MTVAVAQLPRYFKINGMLIADPMPQLDIEQSLEHLSHQYPVLRHTKVYESDAEVKDDKIVYNVFLPPVKSNG